MVILNHCVIEFLMRNYQARFGHQQNGPLKLEVGLHPGGWTLHTTYYELT
jgi:hypothetical protein